jgi:hypothetical protein
VFAGCVHSSTYLLTYLLSFLSETAARCMIKRPEQAAHWCSVGKSVCTCGVGSRRQELGGTSVDRGGSGASRRQVTYKRGKGCGVSMPEWELNGHSCRHAQHEWPEDGSWLRVLVAGARREGLGAAGAANQRTPRDMAEAPPPGVQHCPGCSSQTHSRQPLCSAAPARRPASFAAVARLVRPAASLTYSSAPRRC